MSVTATAGSQWQQASPRDGGRQSFKQQPSRKEGQPHPAIGRTWDALNQDALGGSSTGIHGPLGPLNCFADVEGQDRGRAGFASQRLLRRAAVARSQWRGGTSRTAVRITSGSACRRERLHQVRDCKAQRDRRFPIIGSAAKHSECFVVALLVDRSRDLGSLQMKLGVRDQTIPVTVQVTVRLPGVIVEPLTQSARSVP